MDNVDIVRSFSRTYTQYLQLLNKTILDSPLALIEARVLYEIHLGNLVTAKSLRGNFNIDKGYLSRVIKKLIDRGWVESTPSAADKRRLILTLTNDGKAFFQELNNKSSNQISQILSRLNPYEKTRFVSSLGQANQILSHYTTKVSLSDISIRSTLVAGDIGFVIQSHGELYKEENGYSILLEQYVAEGLIEYIHTPKPHNGKIWLCEHNKNKIGFLLLFDRGEGVAQLRFFFIYPEYRGIGLGNHLMSEFVAHLQQHAFSQCYLWTTNEQVTATKLYKRYGFQLVQEKPSREFGKELIEQKYVMTL